VLCLLTIILWAACYCIRHSSSCVNCTKIPHWNQCCCTVHMWEVTSKLWNACNEKLNKNSWFPKKRNQMELNIPLEKILRKHAEGMRISSVISCLLVFWYWTLVLHWMNVKVYSGVRDAFVTAVTISNICYDVGEFCLAYCLQCRPCHVWKLLTCVLSLDWPRYFQ
jgi:hypothetical protein